MRSAHPTRISAPLIAFEAFFTAADRFAYRPVDGKPGTYLFLDRAEKRGVYDREVVGPQHVAFMVRRRSQVHAMNDLALGRGDPVLHPPQELPQHPPPYYASFWLDPYGFKLEAVCHRDEA